MECRELWQEYKEKHTKKAREDLILKYLPLVKHIAHSMAINFPSHIIVDDIINDGIMGLIQAIDSFNINRGIEFKTFATFRIRGSILDALRAFDWAPRSLRKKSRDVEKAFAILENELSRPATNVEMAEYLKINLKDFEKLLEKIQGLAIISLDDFISKESEKTKFIDVFHDKEQILPEGLVEKKELVETLGRFIEELPEKERLIVTLYYYEELNLKEISQVMELSESRISQLHTKAIFRIKGKMKRYFTTDAKDYSIV